MIDKLHIRKGGKAARAGLTVEVRAAFDRRITARCQEELDWFDYERIMVYLPIKRQHEIDTWPLIRWIWATWPAVAVYVPVTRGERMAAVQITPLSTYEEDARGIPEPVEGSELAPGDTLDVILTALLGFDARGNRVGYGGGFYDRFLPKFPQARRVGLGYECLLVGDGIAAEPHDIRLHDVITETEMRVFTRTR